MILGRAIARYSEGRVEEWKGGRVERWMEIEMEATFSKFYRLEKGENGWELGRGV